jgi:hypothetical protein
MELSVTKVQVRLRPLNVFLKASLKSRQSMFGMVIADRERGLLYVSSLIVETTRLGFCNFSNTKYLFCLSNRSFITLFSRLYLYKETIVICQLL